MVAPGCTSRAALPSPTLATKKVLQPSLVSARAIGASPSPYASALITPAHSAQPEAWFSLAQLARNAIRSTVRMARAEEGIGALGRAETKPALPLALTPTAPACIARARGRKSA